MIVRKFEDILPSPLAVHTDTWSSFRLLTRDDGLGFSLHETWIQPGTQTHIWYKHHYEAVYCIEGEGEIETVDTEGRGTGQVVTITPGVMYALNRHDRHFLRARSRLRLICVFSPPLRGDERHGPDGAYPAPEAAAEPGASASGGTLEATLTSATPRAATRPVTPGQGLDHLNGDRDDSEEDAP